MRGYDHKNIEKRAQELWESLALYETDLKDTDKEPYYVLFEFPYPSGDLHIGHWYAYALTDIFARFKRMEGKNVLFPIGFDAFGLPAENAAIKNKVDPREWTYQNMERMREQIKTMGTSVDWSKEVVSCSPEYYKWTQWLFKKLFEHGLAEHREAPVKWCPVDQTVLANEQVNDGKCERCGNEVEEKRLTQWFLKITDYAERLLNDLDPLPWREEIKDAQRAWIGKSEGAKLSFPLTNGEDTIHVFTTRPDTVFGATYVVLAPEHELVQKLLPSLSNAKEVTAYVNETKKKTERERSENKEKTGVILEGVRAINPATKEKIPVYIADYALASYGTGAVMAVPAHDERDFEFAQRLSLPVRHVVIPQVTDVSNPPQEGKEDTFRKIILAIVRNPETGKFLVLKWKKQPWTTFITGGIEDGEDPIEAAIREITEETGYTNIKLSRVLGGMTESSFFAAHKDVNRRVNALPVLFDLVDETRAEIDAEEADQYDIAWLTADEVARAKLQHAEFDIVWQRIQTGMDAYTGPGVLIDSGEFTDLLSEEAKWDIVSFVGGERTTNYRLRDWLVSRQRYWGCPIPIVYDPEGKPHPVKGEHLPWLLPTDVDFSPNSEGSPLRTSKELRERVTTLYGEGWTPEFDTLDTFVDSSWYFYRYLDSKDENDFSDQALMKHWLPVDRYSGGSEHTTMHLLYSRFFHKALHDLALVPNVEPFIERYNRGLILGPDGQKMSKSKGNVVNPDVVVREHGADAVRMYLAFIGPYNEPGNYPWNLDGVESMRRFLERVSWLPEKVVDAEPSLDLSRAVAKAIEKVQTDIERFKFNTAISALMILLKEIESNESVPRSTYHTFLTLLAPLAPHLAEHLFSETGGEGSVHQAQWPALDPDLLKSELKTVIVQVAGKKRGEILLSESATEEEALALATQIASVFAALGERAPARVIYVPGRILNLVPWVAS